MASVCVAMVAVEHAAFTYDQLYSYLVPDSLRNLVQRGVRVVVPFGRGNTLRQGMVFSVGEEQQSPRLKSVITVLDQEPVLEAEDFEIIRYMTDAAFCSRYDVVRCLLPPGLSVEAKTTYRLSPSFDKGMLPRMAPEEQQLLRLLLAAPSQREVDMLFSGSGSTARRKTAQSLIEAGLLVEEQQITRKVGDKTVRMVALAEGVDPETAYCTPKQREVLEILAQVGMAPEREVAYHAGVSDSVIRTLLKKGLCRTIDQQVSRTPRFAPAPPPEPLVLSPRQQEVFEGLCSLYEQPTPQAALLFGVTGSGKTQVFIRLIQHCLADGKQAILMVPEISLTPQMVQKFQGWFGRQVAVLHSGLSAGERLDEYRRIRSGEARIVIGTRISVFAPCRQLGLIIMDEEGEHSYKSDMTPRYHARDIAKLRSGYHRSLLLLASATPSIESYYAAQKGRYTLFRLSERYGSATLPRVEMVNMAEEELNHYRYNTISHHLSQALADTFERGEQSILLLNRRGYASFPICTDCGQPVTCPNCSTALTYHLANGYLMCHYCGYTRHPGEPCPSCGGKNLRMMGCGTQKVEELVETQLPKARILRMDADTTFSRYACEEKFAQFAAGEYDIMIGTQMVAKGLNFPNVTLVGVLGADHYLYSGDFRCAEKTFSLVTQVVGRSGRFEKPGVACIQTLTPDHPALIHAARQDYEAFYKEEIQNRKTALLPPFCDLAVVGFSGVDEDRTWEAARVVRDRLARLFTGSGQPVVILGAAPAAIYRMSGRYRVRIVLKCRNNAATRALIRRSVVEEEEKDLPYGVSIYLDMNGDIV